MLIPYRHPLFQIHNKKRLASILKTNINYFKSLDTSYKVFPFEKKIGSKERDLFNTESDYKRLLRRLNKLLCQLNIPDYVYAGVPKKDFLKNALSHRNNPYTLSLDIKNFFPSTNDSYIYGLFLHKFQTSPDIAKILTQLTTYPQNNMKNRHLPQGFPTSTILSFLAYFDLFNGIYQKSKNNDIHFTLFVDDMTFSSEKRIPKSFLKHVTSIIKKYNLEIHPKKIYRGNPYNYSKITGVVIEPNNKDLKAPNKLQKKMFSNFQAVHDYTIRSYNDYIEFKRLVLTLDGQLKSIKRIEPNRHTPFIDKVLRDIKSNFLCPTVKGAPYDLLKKEFNDYPNKQVI